jgi:hypothetical protein
MVLVDLGRSRWVCGSVKWVSYSVYIVIVGMLAQRRPGFRVLRAEIQAKETKKMGRLFPFFRFFCLDLGSARAGSRAALGQHTHLLDIYAV